MRTFVIPMAGRGSRFIKEGFSEPKYMVKVKGKTLFEYSINSLPLDLADKLVFICLKDHEVFNVSKLINDKANHSNIEIILLDEVTRGQAETVYLTRDRIGNTDELLIYNIDTCFKSSSIRNLLLDNKQKKDGILGAFIDKSNDDKWSFAKIDKGGGVVKTTEKEKISNYALTGLYHFSESIDFFEIAKEWIEEEKTVQNEFYIAPMYNDLIKRGKKYVIDVVDTFVPLGTPEEVKSFASKN